MSIVFVAIALFATQFPQTKPKNVELISVKVLGTTVTPTSTQIVPVFSGENSLPILTAESIYAVDLDTNTVLFQKNAELPLLPASTAKIVTSLTALDYYDLDTILKVPLVRVDGQKMGLIEGEQISVNDLLYSLLIYSANDAAEVLAVNYPGGRDSFVSAMNLKAEEAGLLTSNFTHPAGLDQVNQYTTAKDLVVVTQYALKNPTFSEIVSTKYYKAKSANGKLEYNLKNINKLLFEVDGVKGVKTGWTENAKENLVTFYDKDGKRIVISLLGSDDRFGETKSILDWILKNYSWTNEYQI